MRDAPLNTILVQGIPEEEEKVIETVANCYPGRFVAHGNGDNDVLVCTASLRPIGILGWEQTSAHYRPADRDTIYVVNDRAKVLRGPGVIVMASLASGQNVTKLGTKLVVTAAGELAIADVLNVASGTTAVTSTLANGDVIEGEVPDNPPVAEAMEIVDASSGAEWIMVKLLI